MIRHLFIAALRNMAANKLQTLIAVLGLSIGITAALLMALVIRNQLTYDHFIPGYERTYVVVTKTIISADRPPFYTVDTDQDLAPFLKLNAPEVDDTTRLMFPAANERGENGAKLVRNGIAGEEYIYWADPNLAKVLPLPVFRGDLRSALSNPDGIVIPRAAARKYFGREDVVGQIIQLNGHPMTVRAVIEDVPARGTSLRTDIFASALSTYAPPPRPHRNPDNAMTFVQLKHGASLANLEHWLQGGMRKNLPESNTSPRTFYLVPLDQLSLHEGLHPGAKTKLLVAGLVGALVLFIAAINFVNLLTATAARRGIEVGVRKVCGAAQRTLIMQFLGEAILTVFFATCVAVAASEWLLPAFNAFLTTGGTFDYGHNPDLLGALLTAVAVLGLLAGAWPAFVMSSFRPAGVLKGVMRHSRAADLVRHGLIVVQFAILIGFVIAATVIYQQNQYATRESLRADIDQILVVDNAIRGPTNDVGGCERAYRAELRKLPGVAGVSCAESSLTGGQHGIGVTYRAKFILGDQIAVDPGLFALYGIKPLAGSLPPATEAGDYNPSAAPEVVLNETAVRRLGFASPQAAVGETVKVPWQAAPDVPSVRKMIPIAAVVPDITFYALAEQPIVPIVYTVSARANRGLVSIKLKGQQIPATLAAVDRIFAQIYPGIPINRYFMSEHMQSVYLGVLRQAQLFAIFSAIAIFLACFGLLGLSVSSTERRTKEIGIRKALGATSGEVTSLLLWDFVKPVLWANLIAWPASWYFLNRWLNGFAYHVVLSPLVFVGATLVALTVALLTVAIQSALVARQKPVLALRYE